MSKSSELDTKVKRYIISCIDGTGYNAELKTTADKIRFVEECFRSEYGHEIARKGDQSALAEYFAGLPSCCTVEFKNADILALAEQWGILTPYSSESEKDTVLDRWFTMMAAKTLQLFRGYRVPKECNGEHNA